VTDLELLADLLEHPVDHARRMVRSLPSSVLFGVGLPLITAAGIVSRSADQSAGAVERARCIVHEHARLAAPGWITLELTGATPWARRRFEAKQELERAEATARRDALLEVAGLPAVDLLWLLVMGWDPARCTEHAREHARVSRTAEARG
jgi:hypothetical protein